MGQRLVITLIYMYIRDYLLRNICENLFLVDREAFSWSRWVPTEVSLCVSGITIGFFLLMMMSKQSNSKKKYILLKNSNKKNIKEKIYIVKGIQRKKYDVEGIQKMIFF